MDETLSITDYTEPTVITGGLAVDDRGALSFCNNLDLSGSRRYYVIANHERNFVRGWHGSRRNAKVFIPITGTFVVAWRNLYLDDAGLVDLIKEPENHGRVVLSELNPQILVLPGGFLNANSALTEGARLMVINSLTLDEAKNDDFRAPLYSKDDWADFVNWYPFSVEER